ncbi:MAG TPA: sugar ABC transporter ATP-binding protein [Ktedonobacterales bacterium]|nr:sugar ABC transporter ATP-binding protein [Ktedonobacterales bacterium]
MTTTVDASSTANVLPDRDERVNDMEHPFLEVCGLSKQFGGVHALRGVDLAIAPGVVHGLVGANGAGKSTLIRILAGVQSPDEGEIRLDGAPVVIRDAQDATRLGLTFIHQELNLVPKFTGLQNLTLGMPKPSRLGLLDWRAVRREVSPVIERLGITFPLDIPVEALSVAQQWMLTIGRALVRRARLIAMDEPTASLSAEESNRLFQVIRDLSAEGIAILYVSHRLHEIESLCSRVTVFKDGERVAEFGSGEIARDTLVRAIVGEEMQQPLVANERLKRLPERQGAVVLEARGLRRGRAVRDVSLTVHRGEIVGLGGLVGSGRTEVIRLLFGADPLNAGTILLDGTPLSFRGPHDAVRHKLGLVPEERRSQGLMLTKSIAFNMLTAAPQRQRIVRHLPLISLRRGATQVNTLAHRLHIKAPSVATPVGNLSGGNQQKVVIGKWLAGDTRVLLLDEPTRGVDVGARAEMYAIIRELAASGTAILMVSSEAEELAQVCDRVLVMVEGRIVGELTGDQLSEERVLRLSYAHSDAADAVDATDVAPIHMDDGAREGVSNGEQNSKGESR